MDINKLNNSKLTKHFSVLFVEDDKELCQTTSELLEALFKSVKVAADREI